MGQNEVWFLGQFKKPYLNLQSNNIKVIDTHDLLVEQDSFELEVTLPTTKQRDEMYNQLLLMLNSSEGIWQDISEMRMSGDFYQLLESLYTSGFMRDDLLSRVKRKEEANRITSILSVYTDRFIQFFNGKNEKDKLSLTVLLSSLFKEAYTLAAEAELIASAQRFTKNKDFFDSQNFYLVTAVIQLRYLQRNNPVALILITKLLHNFLNIASDYAEKYEDMLSVETDFEESLNEHLGNIYSFRDVEAAVFAAFEYVEGLTANDADRVAMHDMGGLDLDSAGSSGINFALESEEYARLYQSALGESRFLNALRDSNSHKMLAPACYLQEYFVNYRFVETITPMITKRLTPEFKKFFWRYYAEEIGHEEYELNTCKTLGITEEFIERNLPLPLTQAFCDAYSYLSENESIGYLVSIMVTEGIPGELSVVNSILSKSEVLKDNFNEASAEHEQLNQELGHQYLSRIFLAEIDFVSVAEQNRALNILSYMIELNFRAWEHLYERVMVDEKGYLEKSICA